MQARSASHAMSPQHMAESESAADLHASEVTSPGLWRQRKREVKEVEEHAGAPGTHMAAFELSPLLSESGHAVHGVPPCCSPLPPSFLLPHLPATCSPVCPVVYFPWLNRGTNFSMEERQQLRLEGLLPPVVESLDLQAERWGQRRCLLHPAASARPC
jgi:hypothetical protein